jgi:hypothetical protein
MYNVQKVKKAKLKGALGHFFVSHPTCLLLREFPTGLEPGTFGRIVLTISRSLHPSRSRTVSNLLIIRTLADEASSGMSVSHFFGFLATSLTRKFAGIAVWMTDKVEAIFINLRSAKWRFLAFYASVSGPLFGLMLFEKHVTDHHLRRVAEIVTLIPIAVGLSPLILLLICIIFYTTVILIAPIAVIVMALTIIPFGMSAFWLTLFYETSVEASPQGRWSVLALPTTEKTDLNHSATYDDPHAIKTIIDWIQDRSR